MKSQGSVVEGLRRVDSSRNFFVSGMEETLLRALSRISSLDEELTGGFF